jgi:alpha-L-fucosidase
MIANGRNFFIKIQRMRKHILFLGLMGLLLFQANLYSQPESVAQHDARMQWWRDARFGMFIHWGLYAVPAGEWNGKTGYGEWIRTSAEIPLETYNQFAGQFNPVQFNADNWVKMAKDAGMRYIVITSKHHDGFCMFETKQTDFSILSTPFKRDPMKELAVACKKYGITFCYYHSIMDWHHPDYLPRRNWETDRPTEGADFRKYVDYMKAQLKELLTNYGEIGVLWFDGEWENTWNEKYGKEIYNYCRTIQPGLIINNRVGAGRMDMEGLTKEGMFGGDFGTPEQQIPATGLPGTDWETCMTMNDHWGYNKNDKNFKSPKELIRNLVDIASKGGNFLLNVGPTAEGLIPPESVESLRTIGKWMDANGEAIRGSQASPFKSIEWGRCTRKEIPGGVRLYLHVFDWPQDQTLVVRGCLNEVKSAYFLQDPKKTPIPFQRVEDAILFTVPAISMDPFVTVIAVDLVGKLDMTEPPVIQTEFDAFVDSALVKIQTTRENVKIHYTLDGTTPTNASPYYTTPLRLAQTTTVTARCYREDKPVSSPSRKTIEKVKPIPAIVVSPSVQGLSYTYYEGKWDDIPDFSKEPMVQKGEVKNFVLTLSPRKEHYAIQYEGWISIPTTDVYGFFTESDDGSNLYIDGQLVVKNNGLHARKEGAGSIPLEKGFHKIRVDYHQQTGGAELQVSIKGGGMNKQVIPEGLIYTLLP